jgi:hypothetical protein
MALALKNMKASGANVTINPDEFVRQLNVTGFSFLRIILTGHHSAIIVSF